MLMVVNNFGPNSVMCGLRTSQASYDGGPKQMCSIKVSIDNLTYVYSVGTLVRVNLPLAVFTLNPTLVTCQNMKCEIIKITKSLILKFLNLCLHECLLTH